MLTQNAPDPDAPRNMTLDSQLGSQGESNPTNRQVFLSFNGDIRAEGLLQRPDRYRYWTKEFFAETSIPRGAGLSYAAASFRHEGLSVEHICFNRILGFDSARQVVDVEAGISLAELYDFLTPRGLYLPTQPGHGRITIGGCIAADVHGKNQARDGTFMEQVEALTLFHPEHGILEVSREKEPGIFRLTCGGYGLTGHILSARLRAKVIPSLLLEVNYVSVEDTVAGAEVLKHAAPSADFVLSWHDFTTRSAGMGSGFVQIARFVTCDSDDTLSSHSQVNLIGEPPALAATSRGRWRICFLNRSTIRVLNTIYKYTKTAGFPPRRIPLRDALFPIHQAQYYFKLFGARGFHECQIVVPFDKFEEFVTAIQTHLDRYPYPITLASAKLFRGSPELLRFTGDGICFALNFPRNVQRQILLSFLDDLTIAIGGKPNIIKDSRLPRAVVEASYPDVSLFRQLRREFDPNRRFRSELSDRLGL